jgi:hypothetical protein
VDALPRVFDQFPSGFGGARLSHICTSLLGLDFMGFDRRFVEYLHPALLRLGDLGCHKNICLDKVRELVAPTKLTLLVTVGRAS